jgi:hypothetical protein
MNSGIEVNSLLPEKRNLLTTVAFEQIYVVFGDINIM